MAPPNYSPNIHLTLILLFFLQFCHHNPTYYTRPNCCLLWAAVAAADAAVSTRASPALPSSSTTISVATNCSFDTRSNVPTSTLPSLQCKVYNASHGLCAGVCGGCRFNYTFINVTTLAAAAAAEAGAAVTDITTNGSTNTTKRKRAINTTTATTTAITAAGIATFYAAPRCILAIPADGGPAQAPGKAYALSTVRPLSLERGPVTVMRPATTTHQQQCPEAFGSFNMARSCVTCHTDPSDCSLRCECKAGTDSHYAPMGCNLWACNDLALVHDSLTCRGAICPPASTPKCPQPSGSYGDSCSGCWVDDACVMRCACKTPPDGHLSSAGCDLYGCNSGSSSSGGGGGGGGGSVTSVELANINGALYCNSTFKCPTPPLPPPPPPPPSPSPPPPSPSPPPPSPPSPPPPPPPSPAACKETVIRVCEPQCGSPTIVHLACYESCAEAHCNEIKAGGCPCCHANCVFYDDELIIND